MGQLIKTHLQRKMKILLFLTSQRIQTCLTQLEALKENVDKDNFQELPVQIKAEDEKLERLSISESQQMDF